VPLTPQTRHLINADRLRALKLGCLVINAARGSVIDETALAEALESGHVGGAAIDAFEQEPVPADHPFCKLPNVILTPHIGSATPEAMDRMAQGAAQGVLDVLQGRRPKYVYNREVLG
jgi:phosphoglycerate dehydrogenase-like enzyme